MALQKAKSEGGAATADAATKAPKGEGGIFDEESDDDDDTMDLFK